MEIETRFNCNQCKKPVYFLLQRGKIEQLDVEINICQCALSLLNDHTRQVYNEKIEPDYQEILRGIAVAKQLLSQEDRSEKEKMADEYQRILEKIEKLNVSKQKLEDQFLHDRARFDEYIDTERKRAEEITKKIFQLL
jgi:hypothetical protein